MKKRISISLLLGLVGIAAEAIAGAPFPVMLLTVYVSFAYPLVTSELGIGEVSVGEMNAEA